MQAETNPYSHSSHFLILQKGNLVNDSSRHPIGSCSQCLLLVRRVIRYFAAEKVIKSRIGNRSQLHCLVLRSFLWIFPAFHVNFSVTSVYTRYVPAIVLKRHWKSLPSDDLFALPPASFIMGRILLSCFLNETLLGGTWKEHLKKSCVSVHFIL